MTEDRRRGERRKRPHPRTFSELVAGDGPLRRMNLADRRIAVSHTAADLAESPMRRRNADRRISPAVGEFAIQECERLRARNAELAEALHECVIALAAEWPDDRDGPDSSPRTPGYIRAAKALAREALKGEAP